MQTQQDHDEPVPRVKLQPNYDWSQDINTIRVRIPIPNTSIKNIIVEVADLVLKVNAIDRKLVKTLDLWDEILLERASIVYANNILEITLQKKDRKEWQHLLFQEENKALRIQRRQDSFARKEALEQKFGKDVQDLKTQLDTHSTREQMRIDDEVRKKIETAKAQEKEKAISNVFQNPTSEDNREDKNFTQQSQDNQQETSIQAVTPHMEIFNKKIDEYEQIAKNIPKPAIYDESFKNASNIFENRDLKPKAQIPEVRKINAPLQIEFTERIYPNLAAREQHFKDAPLPRQNKKFSKDERENNPFFLKDKGDEFFKNKDYYSALNAYGSAFKTNSSLIICQANRAACFLQVFNYQECIVECNHFLELYEQQKDTDTNLLKIVYWKTLLRRAISTAWMGKLNDAELQLNDLRTKVQQNEVSQLTEKFNSQIDACLLMIQIRKKCLTFKQSGDFHFKASRYQQAQEYYQQALQIQENEFVLGNLGLIYMKLQKYDESLEFTNKALKIVEKFLIHSNNNPNMGRQSFQESYQFLVKLYMRKAKILFTQQKLTEALQSIKQAIALDENNKEARDILNQIERLQIREETIQIKKDATQRLREGKIDDALTLYNECLKKFTPQEDLMDLLEVLLNKCICCMGLNQFDDILGACVRGIKLINNQMNKVLSFEKLPKENKQKLTDYHIRFLVRRSNAYLKQGQIFHAISDLEQAIQLDPANQQLVQDLEKLRKLT